MKVTLDAAPFRDAVGWVARGLPNRPTVTMPLLGGMLVEAGDGVVTLSAFDYDTSRRATVPGGVHTPGRVLVGGRILADIVAKAAGDDVSLVATGAMVVVTCGSLEAQLPTMAAEDYPKLPELPTAVGAVEAAAFAAAVARVACAASKDEALPVLTGVELRAAAGQPLRLGACDRYRAAWLDLEWECLLDGGPEAVVVPADTLADAVKAAVGTVTVHAGTGASGEGLFGLAWPGRWVTTRLIDGAFPPYEKAIPKVDKLTSTVRVAPAALLAALDRVKPAAEGKRPLRVDVEDGVLTVTVAGSRADVSEATDHLDVEYDGAERLTFHANSAYLRDALLHTSGPVASIGHVAYGRAMRITGDDGYVHGLMPIKVQ